jgi:hypothetical protein
VGDALTEVSNIRIRHYSVWCPIIKRYRKQEECSVIRCPRFKEYAKDGRGVVCDGENRI